MKQYFAENLKKCRMERNLSQEQLAERLGVSNQAVSKWECAVSYPDIELLVGIADFFEITVDELLGRKSEGTVRINELPDDGVIRIVQCVGRRIARMEDNPEERLLLRMDADAMKKVGETGVLRIEIAGNADIEGDVYGEVSAEGDVNCGNISSDGSVHADGALNCGNISSGGSVHAEGDVNCGNISSQKEVVLGGDVNCGNITANDTANFAGEVKCAKIEGNVRAEADLSSQKLEAAMILCKKLTAKTLTAKTVSCEQLTADRLTCENLNQGEGEMGEMG